MRRTSSHYIEKVAEGLTPFSFPSSDLFDVRVDELDSEVLGIKGKPEPDIFLEAARRLKAKPERAVVIEDAISGVQAGKAGIFRLVVGAARTGDKDP